VDYDKTLHDTFAKGRRLSEKTVCQWIKAVAEFLPDRPNLRLLDLGSGTGRFAVPLAERLGLTVVGVEPSEKMRRQAEENGCHPSLSYAAGCAEDIPCEDETFDAAFLSMVLHHIRSIPKPCRELVRVLKVEGVVLVRNSFKNRLESVPFYPFFPWAKAADNARLPKLEDVVSGFEAAGFECIAHKGVTQHIDDSLKAHCERMKLRALSTFDLISGEEFREGIRAMEEAAKAEVEPKPVVETIDFLVFRRRS